MKKATKFWWENLKKKGSLGDLSTAGKTILIEFYRNKVRGMGWFNPFPNFFQMLAYVKIFLFKAVKYLLSWEMVKLFQIMISLKELGSSAGRKQCIRWLYKLLEASRNFINWPTMSELDYLSIRSKNDSHSTGSKRIGQWSFILCSISTPEPRRNRICGSRCNRKSLLVVAF